MLRIGDRQKAAFPAAGMRDFERRAAAHLKQAFPAVCAPLGNEAVLENVRYGIRRSAKYGITSERDVVQYIDFMFVFGRDFDQDAALPWAGAILEDQRIKDGTARMEALASAGQAHLYNLANAPKQT